MDAHDKSSFRAPIAPYPLIDQQIPGLGIHRAQEASNQARLTAQTHKALRRHKSGNLIDTDETNDESFAMPGKSKQSTQFPIGPQVDIRSETASQPYPPSLKNPFLPRAGDNPSRVTQVDSKGEEDLDRLKRDNYSTDEEDEQDGLEEVQPQEDDERPMRQDVDLSQIY